MEEQTPIAAPGPQPRDDRLFGLDDLERTDVPDEVRIACRRGAVGQHGAGVSARRHPVPQQSSEPDPGGRGRRLQD